AKVYLALLSKREASLTDLQKLSGVRSNKISEVVNNLVRQGFCSERRIGNRRFLYALDPRSSLKPALEELETMLEQGNALRKSLGKLYEKAEEVKEPFEYIEIIHGSENVHTKYMELLRNAKYDALNFTRPPFASVTQPMYEEQMVLLKRFLDRGGKVRGVFEVNEDSPRRMYDVSYRSYQLGEKFRIAPKLPLKMYIFDRENLLIADKSALNGGDEISMTVIKQKTTVDGYVALFEFMWEQSEDYENWIVGKEELMKRKLAESENSSVE
ncbi:MAG: hypothetical protein HQ542_02390, partial [Bacteroidia bacterium]|nr:hypothetical protein [Bacteroidia bacterium]